MPSSHDILDAIKAEVKRRIIDEYIPRIEKCLHILSNDEIWRRPNKSSNSVGNLILHLCGNVHQWLGNGIGDLEDERRRDAEFDEQVSLEKEELMEHLASARRYAFLLLETSKKKTF